MYRRGVDRDPPGSRRAWLAIAAALAPVALLAALVTTPRWQMWWSDQPWSRPVLVARVVSVTACFWGASLLVNRRPANRCGQIAVALGVAYGLWLAVGDRLPYDGWWPFLSMAFAYTMRPLLIWLVLAWPTGHLDRPSRRLLAVYVPFAVASYVLDNLGGATQDWPGKPLQLWPDAPISLLLNSISWDVGGLVAAAAVLVVAWRRRLRYRGAAADVLGRPGWWAAVALATGDLVLFGLGPLRRLMADDNGLTAFGAFVQVVEQARWGAAVGVLAFGARTVWRARRGAERSVILDAGSEAPIGATVAAALRDPQAAALVRLPDGRWVDEDGRPRSTPSAGDERAVTLVARDGVPLAAIEHTAALAGHPTVLDGAAAALGLRLDALREQATADIEAVELRRLGRQLLDAEDEARRRLERDLHDGAQQTLVGLAIHASLAARTARRDDAQRARLAQGIAEAVERARDELAIVAAGRPPALLAERGLTGALSALVVTAGLPVTVGIGPCEDLPADVQRAVWFTATEAVGNALKHACASRLSLRLVRDGDAVGLEVTDDGVGGLTAVPRALAERVTASAGHVDIDSPIGQGTRVHAVFHVAAEATV